MALRIFLIEDRPRALWAEQKCLQRSLDCRIAGVAATGSSALAAIERLQPDAVVQDMQLPARAVELTKAIKARWPRIEVLVVSDFEQDDAVQDAIRAGASGYLLRRDGPQKLPEVLAELCDGGAVIQPKLARRLFAQLCGAEGLTPAHHEPIVFSERELEMLRSVARGSSATEVAEAFGISVATVRGHVQHIYEKLGVHNRIAAIKEGIRTGLIQLEQTTPAQH